MMPQSTPLLKLTLSDIQLWIANKLSQKLQIPSTTIDIHKPFHAYGIDSMAAYTLSGELSDWLQCDLDPTIFYDYPNIATLSQHLVQLIHKNKIPGD